MIKRKAEQHYWNIGLGVVLHHEQCICKAYTYRGCNHQKER
jgi:hypothetical protein